MSLSKMEAGRREKITARWTTGILVEYTAVHSFFDSQVTREGRDY